MTIWFVIAALLAVPVGYGIAHFIFQGKDSPQPSQETALDVARERFYETRVTTEPPDDPPSVSQRDEPVEPSAVVRNEEHLETRLRADRDRLTEDLAQRDREVSDLRSQLETVQARVTAGAAMRVEAEEVGRDAGARMVIALRERDSTLALLQAEKANHAETHAELDAAREQIHALSEGLDRAKLGRALDASGGDAYGQLQSEISQIREVLQRMDPTTEVRPSSAGSSNGRS